MKSNGTNSDNPHAKCNMPFDPIKLEFTCLNKEKLKVNGIVEKDGELKLRFQTHACPNCPYNKECAKNNKYRVLYEPFNPFFFERKKNIPFQKRKRNLQITSHTQRRSILRNKRNTRIPTIQKNRMRKSRNRPNTRSHSTQHQKNKKPLKCNLNLKKIVLFFC